MFDLIPFEDMGLILEEFRRVLGPDGKPVLVNMTRGESRPGQLYELVYNISPRTMGGCRGVALGDTLQTHGFEVQTHEYYQQMFFPSEVIVDWPSVVRT